MKIVPNIDSRRMQPLPWGLEQKAEGKAIDMVSHNGKRIASFWGGDDMVEGSNGCPTEDQKKRHAAYALHACNYFPHMQRIAEALYGLTNLPAHAKEIIETMMADCYYADVPPITDKESKL